MDVLDRSAAQTLAYKYLRLRSLMRHIIVVLDNNFLSTDYWTATLAEESTGCLCITLVRYVPFVTRLMVAKLMACRYREGGPERDPDL